jgi:hypothetical protein
VQRGDAEDKTEWGLVDAFLRRCFWFFEQGVWDGTYNEYGIWAQALRNSRMMLCERRFGHARQDWLVRQLGVFLTTNV